MKITKHFYSYGDIRDLFSGFFTLVSSNLLANGISLITVIIIAKTLGADDFGRLAIITSFGLVITRIFSLQSTKVFIYMLPHSVAISDENKLSEVIKLSLLLDVCSAVIASIIAFLIVFSWSGFASNLPNEMWFGLLAISASILTSCVGFANGLLRVFGKFKSIGLVTVSVEVFKLIGALFISSIEPTLVNFAVLTAISISLANSLLILCALAYLEKRVIRKVFKISVLQLFDRSAKVMKNFIISNLDSIVRSFRELDILVIGSIIGSEQTGIYKIAKQISMLVQACFDQTLNVIYPKLVKLNSENAYLKFDRVISQTSIWIGSFAGVMVLVFSFTGHYIIQFLFGDEYLGSFNLAIILLLGVAIYAFFQPYGPAIQAIGKFNIFFKIHLFASLIYMISLLVFTSYKGSIGAAISLWVMHLVWGAGSFWALKKIKKQTH